MTDRPPEVRHASGPRVALIAHVGTTNLGDEAILAATLDAVGSWTPTPVVCVYSVDPADTTRRHGVVSYDLRRPPTGRATQGHGHAAAAAVPHVVTDSEPIWRRVLRAVPGVRATVAAVRASLAACRALSAELPFLLRSWRQLRGTSLVVVAGSNQLEDWFGGAWGFPYTIYKWVLLARLVGARVVFLSVGSGPLHAALSRSLCVRALNRGRLVSFRDAESQALMKACGFRGPSAVAPDLAFGLEPRDPGRRYGAGPARVLINVFPYKDPSYDPHVRGAGEQFDRYLATLAEVAAGLIDRGHEIAFACSQRADRRVIELVLARLGTNRARGAALIEPQSVDELRGLLEAADFVIATRYHGILLSLLAARPVVALCYQSKSRQLMTSVGLEDFAVNLAETTPAAILARFEAAQAQAEPLRAALWTNVGAIHRASLAQFDAAAPLAGAAAPRDEAARQPARGRSR